MLLNKLKAVAEAISNKDFDKAMSLETIVSTMIIDISVIFLFMMMVVNN